MDWDLVTSVSEGGRWHGHSARAPVRQVNPSYSSVRKWCSSQHKGTGGCVQPSNDVGLWPSLDTHTLPEHPQHAGSELGIGVNAPKVAQPYPSGSERGWMNSVSPVDKKREDPGIAIACAHCHSPHEPRSIWKEPIHLSYVSWFIAAVPCDTHLVGEIHGAGRPSRQVRASKVIDTEVTRMIGSWLVRVRPDYL